MPSVAVACYKPTSHLGVAQGKAGKAPLPLHDVTKVLKDAAEALVEDAKLDRFAAVESNTLRIFPEAHQAEPEVGLEALPVNIQRHQRPTDFDREPSTDTGVE